MEKDILSGVEKVELLLPDVFRLVWEHEEIRRTIESYYKGTLDIRPYGPYGPDMWYLKGKCLNRLEKIMSLAKGIDVRNNGDGKIEEVRFDTEEGLFSVPLLYTGKGIKTSVVPIYIVSNEYRTKLGPLALLGKEKYFIAKHVTVQPKS